MCDEWYMSLTHSGSLWECTPCALININESDKIRNYINGRYGSYNTEGVLRKVLCIEYLSNTHMCRQCIGSTNSKSIWTKSVAHKLCCFFKEEKHPCVYNPEVCVLMILMCMLGDEVYPTGKAVSKLPVLHTD